MGVDFYTCANEGCRRTFPDCGPYFGCTTCYSHFCDDECGDKKVIDKSLKAWEDGNSTCNLCRGESVLDKDLLSFLLKKYKITREQAVEMYKINDKTT